MVTAIVYLKLFSIYHYTLYGALPVDTICFYPRETILINPKHQLKASSNTLHVLGALEVEE